MTQLEGIKYKPWGNLGEDSRQREDQEQRPPDGTGEAMRAHLAGWRSSKETRKAGREGVSGRRW